MDNWPFLDEKNTAAFTVAHITSGEKTILYVSHDLDDGAWQFHPSESSDDNEPKVVALHRIVQIDPSVSSLADLPMGWAAIRENVDSPWQRFRLPTST